MADIIENIENHLNSQGNKMTDEEIDLFSDFLGIDVSKSQDMFLIHNTPNFSEGEVIVLFKDEFFHRERIRLKEEINELALKNPTEYKFTIDTASSVPKSNISGIEIRRQTHSDSIPPKQSEDYIISILYPSNTLEIIICEDKDFAFFIYESLRDWLYSRSKFKK